MCRIINFLSAKGGVGKTSIVFNLSKELSRLKYKVCVVDLYFSQNYLSNSYGLENTVDLKEYLIGNKNYIDIQNKVSNYLCVIKTNNIAFNYIKHYDLIKYCFEELANCYDYILIDTNCFDNRILSLSLDVSNECLIVLNDNKLCIRNTSKLIQRVLICKNILNINLILNQAKIISEIKGIVADEKDIFDILKIQVLFKFKWYFRNNVFDEKESSELFSKFCKSVISNRPKIINYKLEYLGLVGYIKKRRYFKYE